MCPRLLHTSALNITHLEGKCLAARLQSEMHVLRLLSDTACCSAGRFMYVRDSKSYATNASMLVLAIKMEREKKEAENIVIGGLINGDSQKNKSQT